MARARSFFEQVPWNRPFSELWVLHDEDGEVVCYLSHVHQRGSCRGTNCLIHNPSDHRMVTWPLIPRDEVTERMCKHGIGHPDPDALAFQESLGRDLGEHGCDGCCRDVPRRRVRYIRPEKPGMRL